MIVKPKPWYTSRSLWFNSLSLVASLIGVAAASQLVKDYPQAAAGLAAASAAVNLILRVLTTQPLGE